MAKKPFMNLCPTASTISMETLKGNDLIETTCELSVVGSQDRDLIFKPRRCNALAGESILLFRDRGHVAAVVAGHVNRHRAQPQRFTEKKARCSLRSVVNPFHKFHGYGTRWTGSQLRQDATATSSDI